MWVGLAAQSPESEGWEAGSDAGGAHAIAHWVCAVHAPNTGVLKGGSRTRTPLPPPLQENSAPRARADMAHFGEVNTVYGKFFPTDPPARATFAVRALPLGALVEIECVAAL